MVKTFKNLLPQNQKSYDLETWHVALGTQALQSLYKWWPWVDLDLFYGKVKSGHLYVWMGKTVIKSFNGGKLAAKDYIDWIILLMKKIWPQGVVCPCPGAIYLYMTTIFKRGARWLSGRVSDSGARGPGFETYRRCVVSLSKTLYSPKVLVNYQGSDGSVPTWLKNCWLGR